MSCAKLPKTLKQCRHKYHLVLCLVICGNAEHHASPCSLHEMFNLRAVLGRLQEFDDACGATPLKTSDDKVYFPRWCMVAESFIHFTKKAMPCRNLLFWSRL